MSHLITTALIILFIIFVVVSLCCNNYHNNRSHDYETFNGALQSLYSNDGIQDAHITVQENDCKYDPYSYWRGVPWYLPTRNLKRRIFYPYLYEYNIDRYSRIYPYW